jgi:adenosylcobinamide-GDP ribazoletransferase
VTAFLAALQFLLYTPALIRRPFTARELGEAVGFYPLAGLVLGILLAAADIGLRSLFPLEVSSILVLALWIVLTGALHFDGFLDSCDGLLGGRTPERRLEIMRDERTGAYGLAAGSLLLLTQYAALNAIGGVRWPVLLLAPVLGRCAMSLGVVLYPYARTEGLGRDVKDNAATAQAAIAGATGFVIVVALAWAVSSAAPLYAAAAAAAVAWICSAFIIRRVPGMTGDTYGALNMLVEVAVLLAWVAAR